MAGGRWLKEMPVPGDWRLGKERIRERRRQIPSKQLGTTLELSIQPGSWNRIPNPASSILSRCSSLCCGHINWIVWKFIFVLAFYDTLHWVLRVARFPDFRRSTPFWPVSSVSAADCIWFRGCSASSSLYFQRVPRKLIKGARLDLEFKTFSTLLLALKKKKGIKQTKNSPFILLKFFSLRKDRWRHTNFI